jgi:uncharacterized protein
MRSLKITVGRVAIQAELLDTPTADMIWDALPFEGRATRWGDEVYFTAPVQAEREEGAREVVEPGEIAYRADGAAVILAWGPTPVSEAGEIRVASPANVFARTGGDLSVLKDTEAGDLIVVERLD